MCVDIFTVFANAKCFELVFKNMGSWQIGCDLVIYTAVINHTYMVLFCPDQSTPTRLD